MRNLILMAVLSLATAAPAAAGGNLVTVYKSPTCGCCDKWVDHLKEHGFEVKGVNSNQVAKIKKDLKVPNALFSCHTAVVDGYVVEGHVPADLIKKMLKEKPKIIGISVPDMPIGSPGMEGMFSQKYDVLTFDKDGKTSVYATR